MNTNEDTGTVPMSSDDSFVVCPTKHHRQPVCPQSFPVNLVIYYQEDTEPSPPQATDSAFVATEDSNSNDKNIPGNKGDNDTLIAKFKIKEL